MKSYLRWLEDILDCGQESDDRTGTGTIRLTGSMFSHDMSKGFPLVTTKFMATKAIVGELIWFMRGCTNVEKLREITHGKDSDKWVIWDPNYDKQAKDLGYTGGYLGPVYGKQWRDSFGTDQLQNAIDMIKNDPTSRRIIVTSWNPAELDLMALPPCHFAFQFLVNGDKLDLVWYQRSVDSFLGLPFNIASYGLMLEIVAQITGKTPGRLVGMGADCHIYKDHLDQVREQVSREALPLCKLNIKKEIKSLGDMYKVCVDDFEFVDYRCHAPLKGKMSA